MSSMALTFHPKSLNKTGVYVRTLTISDIDRCIELENASFSPEERCSPEKFRYRLTVCPELCHGLFTLTKPHPDTPKGASDFKPQEILIAHIISTKTTSPRVTDAAMRIPKALLSKYAPNHSADSSTSSQPVSETPTATASQTSKKDESVSQVSTKDETPAPTGGQSTASDKTVATEDDEGHHEVGDTIAMHSVCVAESYRKMGYSQILLKDYISRMRDAGVSKRLAMIVHKGIIPVYTKCQFKNMGESKVQFAGGNWYDVVYEFNGPPGKGFRGRG